MRPLRRRELIRKLKVLGWIGPTPRGRHSYMELGARTVIVPNEHGEDISVSLQMKILREAGIPKRDWESA